MHAAVVTGIIPLGTAVVGAPWLRQRPSAGFWLCALTGCGLVLAFALWQGSGRLVPADGWLLLAVLSTSIAYLAGARVSSVIPAQQVICWVVVGSLPLPLTLPATAWWCPVDTTPSLAAWGGLLYVSLFSMWLGFFAWYGGLAMRQSGFPQAPRGRLKSLCAQPKWSVSDVTAQRDLSGATSKARRRRSSLTMWAMG